ncbi:MAG: septum formation initiator family protein [Deltaproteobacteria bacterium]|jgi:cell division protein FtsB|nr:septum formation initiator family protein [Deltaproteobacteria bacterium]
MKSVLLNRDNESSKARPSLIQRLYQSLDTLLSQTLFWLGVVLAILLGLIGSLFISEDGFIRNSGLKEIKLSLETENARLFQENRQLLARIDRLTTDPAYLESQARKKLRLVRADEVIYRLAEEPDLSDEEVKRQLD